MRHNRPLPVAEHISQCRAIALARSRHSPDDYLLTRGHMEALFPAARIQSERWLGMTKSWIALRHI
jgi:hypothetical protein